MSSRVLYMNQNMTNYFDMKRFENSIYNKTLIREERIKARKKQKVIDNILLLIASTLLIICIAMTLLIAVNQIKIANTSRKIFELERQLQIKKEKIRIKDRDIKDKVKYDNLKMKAYLDLNMITPTDKNIIYFDKSDQGFDRQYDNIR